MAKTSEPPPSLNDLKARLLAGDDTVTAEQLARAAEVAEWEDLRRRAAELKAAEEAEAARLDTIRQIKARVLAAENLDGDQADMDAIAEAATRIIRRHKHRAEVVREAMTALAKQRVKDGETVEGIAWYNAGMGRPEGVTVDGRALGSYAHPGGPIADALNTACHSAGVQAQLLAPQLHIQASRKQPTPEQIAEREHVAERARQAALARIAAQGK